MTREEAARKFAQIVGWKVYQASEYVGLWIDQCPSEGVLLEKDCDRRLILVPAPDAPLHEHLAFVGRVAGAVGPGYVFSRIEFDIIHHESDQPWHVTLEPNEPGYMITGHAGDLSHAALLAGIAAKEAR